MHKTNPSLAILHGLARPNHFARCRQINYLQNRKLLLDGKASPRDSLGLLTMMERIERRRWFWNPNLGGSFGVFWAPKWVAPPLVLARTCKKQQANACWKCYKSAWKYSEISVSVKHKFIGKIWTVNIYIFMLFSEYIMSQIK